MNTTETLTIAALFSMLAAACAAPTGQANQTNDGNEVVATEAQDGQTLKAKIGQNLVVSLIDGGDGGYQWTLVSAGGLGGGAESHVEGSGQPGDFGTDVFTFSTADLPEGSYTVKLVNQQPWDPSTAQPFSVTVNVAQ